MRGHAIHPRFSRSPLLPHDLTTSILEMPRRRQLSHVAFASTNSGFLTLPAEIRQLIYRMLLRSRSDIYVSEATFKRHRAKDPNLISGYQCPCHAYGRGSPLYVHGRSFCFPGGLASLAIHPLHSRSRECGPWASILQSCRSIHQEASPILYADNVFQFENAATADTFRWVAPSAVLLRTIHIVLFPVYKDFNNRVYHIADKSWPPYLKAKHFGLQNDYPNLKQVTLTLGRGLETENRRKLKYLLEPFVDNLGVRIFEIEGLNNESLVETLQSIVRPKELKPSDESNEGRPQIQRSEHEQRPGWINAILWWGKDGETAPIESRRFEGDQRYRRRLFKVDVGQPESMQLSVGESFSRG